MVMIPMTADARTAFWEDSKTGPTIEGSMIVTKTKWQVMLREGLNQAEEKMA